jgi:dethiobiotin synthetase
MAGIYITSVGTGIGKTLLTAILCHQLTLAGRRVGALKPVVSGFSGDDPASDPVLILRSLGQAPTPQSIAAIAPWRFAEPVSPHLAARKEGRMISIDDVAAFCRERAAENEGLLLIEGAGGVMAPIDDAHTSLDLMTRPCRATSTGHRRARDRGLRIGRKRGPGRHGRQPASVRRHRCGDVRPA